MIIYRHASGLRREKRKTKISSLPCKSLKHMKRFCVERGRSDLCLLGAFTRHFKAFFDPKRDFGISHPHFKASHENNPLRIKGHFALCSLFIFAFPKITSSQQQHLHVINWKTKASRFLCFRLFMLLALFPPTFRVEEIFRGVSGCRNNEQKPEDCHVYICRR